MSFTLSRFSFGHALGALLRGEGLDGGRRACGHDLPALRLSALAADDADAGLCPTDQGLL